MLYFAMIGQATQFIETGEINMTYLWLFVWCIVLLLLLFGFIYNKIQKSLYSCKKDLVYQCDKLFYYLAKFQNENKEHKTNTYVMEWLFDLQNPDYLHNYGLIVSKIEWLKSSLHTDVVPDQELSKIKQIQRQLRWKKFFGGLLCVIICLLVLLLIFVLLRVFILK